MSRVGRLLFSVKEESRPHSTAWKRWPLSATRPQVLAAALTKQAVPCSLNPSMPCSMQPVGLFVGSSYGYHEERGRDAIALDVVAHKLVQQPCSCAGLGAVDLSQLNPWHLDVSHHLFAGQDGVGRWAGITSCFTASWSSTFRVSSDSMFVSSSFTPSFSSRPCKKKKGDN